MKDVIIQSMSMSLNGIEETPVETLTLNAGSVQFGDPDPPAPNRDRESLRSWTLDPRTNQ
jgi:hypothetical protein